MKETADKTKVITKKTFDYAKEKINDPKTKEDMQAFK